MSIFHNGFAFLEIFLEIFQSNFVLYFLKEKPNFKKIYTYKTKINFQKEYILHTLYIGIGDSNLQSSTFFASTIPF